MRKQLTFRSKEKIFFPGTKVQLGDQIYASATDGLQIKSTQAMDLRIPMDVLASSSSTISGRYGAAQPLVEQGMPPATGEGDVEPTLKIFGTNLGPSLSGVRVLSIDVGAIDSKTKKKLYLNRDNLLKSQPVITVNGRIFPPPFTTSDEVVRVDDEEKKAEENNGERETGFSYVKFDLDVPDSQLGSGGAARLVISWPFRGERWTAESRMYDPATEFQIIRTGEKTILLKRTGEDGFSAGFAHPVKPEEPSWVAAFNGKSLVLPNQKVGISGSPGVDLVSNNIVQITLGDKDSMPDRMALLSPPPIRDTLVLEVPKMPPAPSAKRYEVAQFDSIWLSIDHSNSAKLAKVTAHGVTLERKPNDKDPANAFSVLIPPSITERAHSFDLNLYYTNNPTPPDATVRVQVTPSPFQQKE